MEAEPHEYYGIRNLSLRVGDKASQGMWCGSRRSGEGQDTLKPGCTRVFPSRDAATGGLGSVVATASQLPPAAHAASLLANSL